MIICFPFLGCEDVVKLDLKTSEPKLVIDASLIWLKNSLGNNQIIQLSLTAPYYSETVPPATGATVTVTDENNNVFDFTEETNTGKYKNQAFIPVINGVYNLKINYKNEIYVATETLQPVVNIERVEQKDDGGFTKDEIEIKAYYTDPKNEENYYLFEIINHNLKLLGVNVYNDKFRDGDEIFAFYSSEDLKPNDELFIRCHGISKRFYEYMYILTQQSSATGGGPFQTNPAILRGNCVNQTNPENFPFGYFRLSEVDEFTYKIK